MVSSNVNLIRPKAPGSAFSKGIVDHIRKIGWVALIAFLMSGAIGLAGYFFLRTALSSAKREETRLSQQIRSLSQVEGLYTIINSRLTILSRVLGSEKNINSIIELTESVSPEDWLAGISIDSDSVRVAVKLTPRTISEASQLVSTLLGLTREGKMNKATLDSLTLDADGMVNISVSFVPTERGNP